MPYSVKLLPCAEKDYYWWKKHRPDCINRIDALLEALKIDPFRGIGRPEPLKHGLHGLWSRRITEEHRMLYEAKGDLVLVYRCRWHYS